MTTLKKSLVAACALSLGAFAMSAQAAENCPAGSSVPSNQEVSALFTAWNDALKTKNPDTVTAMYADNGVLLPTVSNKPRTNHAEIRSYFVKFLKKEPSGVIDSNTITAGCDWATNSGIYTFQLMNDEGKKVPVQARFSYAYEKIGGKWLIISHHSSVMPEKMGDY